MNIVDNNIGQIIINPRLRIFLKEEPEKKPKNSYLIEAEEDGVWRGKDKSYVRNMEVHETMRVIEQWVADSISTEDMKESLGIQLIKPKTSSHKPK